MRIFLNIFILALLLPFSSFAVEEKSEVSPAEKVDGSAMTELKETKEGLAEKLYLKTLPETEKPAEGMAPVPTQIPKANEEFSGNYVFDGKMYFYDQTTGEFRVVDGDSAGTEEATSKPQPLDSSDFLSDIDQQEEGPGYFYEKKWPISLASIARGAQYDGEGVACESWGSGLIKTGPFESKDECEDALLTEKENVLKIFDEYIEKFEKQRTELMLNSELAEYEKLAKIKLDKSRSLELVLRSFQRGCVCMD